MFLRKHADGHRAEGHVCAFDEGTAWAARYVIELDLDVERLEQQYVRLANDGQPPRSDYLSPAFGFRCTLIYDESGLVLDYPGIATRIAC